MIDNKTIEEVKKRLVATYNPLEIYLFGSYAWGQPDEGSDLDLLVVIDQYEKDRYKTMSDGYKALMGLGIFKDIVVYSHEEFNRCQADSTSLCNRVAREGKKIYAKA